MITVAININGNCLMAKSAVRFVDPPTKGSQKGLAQYRTDCNHIIEHNPDDGAIALAHKMLDLLHEEGIRKNTRFSRALRRLASQV